MPEMSGRELAEAVREIRPETRVLYMSGFTDDAVVHYGIAADDMCFIQKPFSPEALALKAREVLDDLRGQNSPQCSSELAVTPSNDLEKFNYGYNPLN